MKKAVVWLIGVIGMLVLVGCATPKIDPSKFTAPRTVVIDDIPDINPVATIQVVTTNWPAQYFSQNFDGFFVVNGITSTQARIPNNTEHVNHIVTNQILASPRPVSIGTGAAMGAVGGAVGALIQASAEETQKKASEFPALVRKAIPNADLRTDLMKVLRESLETKAIQVRIAGETRDMPPRLRWPAKNDKGEAIITGPLASSPPMDADLLVQISPIAVYAAPGPMNSYTRRVGIGVAMFDGRTRRFIGWQAIPFNATDGKFEYMRYDSLVADIDNAAPALRSALMSLVPQLVNVISGNN